jgi:hypothetical protein
MRLPFLSSCKRDGQTYPKRGVASSVSWVRERELVIWTAIEIIICGNSKNEGDSKEPAERDSSTGLEWLGHLELWMRVEISA